MRPVNSSISITFAIAHDVIFVAHETAYAARKTLVYVVHDRGAFQVPYIVNPSSSRPRSAALFSRSRSFSVKVTLRVFSSSS